MAFDNLPLPQRYPFPDSLGVDTPCKEASIHGHIEDNQVNDAESDFLADVAGYDIRARPGLWGAHEGADDDHEDQCKQCFIENLQGVV